MDVRRVRLRAMTGRKTIIYPALLSLSVLLCACQDQEARRQNAELSAKVAALEQKVAALEQAQAHAPTVTEADNATTRAAAQNCAIELSRTLETFKQNSLDHRYPSHQALEMPDSCSHQNVHWQNLSGRAYAFTVNTDDGQELARQTGP